VFNPFYLGLFTEEAKLNTSEARLFPNFLSLNKVFQDCFQVSFTAPVLAMSVTVIVINDI
jgi:hypothetical protein